MYVAQGAVVGIFLAYIEVEMGLRSGKIRRSDIAWYGMDAIRYMIAVLRQALVQIGL